MLGHGALGEHALGETESDGGITISPSSIASGEAFGTAIVSGDVAIIGAGGIATGESFGTAIVSENTGTIVDAGDIATGQAFGTPSIVLVIAPVAIASAEAFGVPFLGEVVTYGPVSRATMMARSFAGLGGLETMGVKFARYIQAGSADSIANSTTNNTLSIDTETNDENSLATLSGNTVTVNTVGKYLVSATVVFSAGVALNGRVACYSGQFDIRTQGYTTAMGITSDLFFMGPTYFSNTSTTGITLKLDNASGQTLDAYVSDLWIIKLD
jgi:hypothetical protein